MSALLAVKARMESASLLALVYSHEKRISELEKLIGGEVSNERSPMTLEDIVFAEACAEWGTEFIRPPKKPIDLPTLGEISRKREEVANAKAVGDCDEAYYWAARAWLRHCHKGREAANSAYEDAWDEP